MRRGWMFLVLQLGALILTAGCEEDAKFLDPLVDEPVIDSEKALITSLERAYREMDLARYTSILSNEEGAGFSFILSELAAAGETRWGYEEEVRVHRRVFEPKNLPEGEPPVDSGLWLRSIDIRLTLQGEFTERADLYVDQNRPLDPARWRATDARYAVSVFFETQGNTDFRIEADENFVVIEDLTKEVGDSGKFLLYVWTDLDAGGKPVVGAGALF
ncbi:MAG: hypothetical protein ACE5G2_09000 [Candidatus Krumholzibacteriia bacterium]